MSDEVEARRLVDKLWSYCNLLRDDGVSTIEYTEQLTYLLFLKMDHERSTRSVMRSPAVVPADCSWPRLLDAQGDDIRQVYATILDSLGKKPGTLGTIFSKAQNRIQTPKRLRQLVADLIDREKWSATGADIKGDAYEQLLSRGAEDIKSGAGQYFTPRAVIQAMVDVIQPTVADTVLDPAAGTGGFLLAAHRAAAQGAQSMTKKQRNHLQDTFVSGYELVDGTARLAAMNLLLHGIGTADGDSVIQVRDALAQDPGRKWSVVLSNPPFGRKSSIAVVKEDGKDITDGDKPYARQDFVARTANKQLNFLQHIMTVLAQNGRGAVVLPDNVLFEGGVGETIRKALLKSFDVHTLLRLPTGIFYAQGVKANVLFFDKKPARKQPWTTNLWVYDLRTNMHFTLKQNPLRRKDLDDFVACYRSGEPRSARVETERFKPYSYEDLIARDKVNLDITWLRDESVDDLTNLPSPAVIAREIVEDLTAALAEFEAVAAALEAAEAAVEPVDAVPAQRAGAVNGRQRV